MGDFSQFYRDGGLFMHFVTISATFAAAYTFQSARLARGVETASGRVELARAMDLAAGCVGLALSMGLLGTLFGLRDTAAAVQGLPTAEVSKAIVRGIAISLNTLTWGLMVALPLGLGGLANRAAAARRLAAAESALD